MSNPTTPFGWQMPTNTDLVTDLPADFEVFGQAVATSMADLLGGTTGQVLKKNSNTDMDFVWSADAAGMTNPMTTTGDVIYSSPGSTPVRLGIGSAGQVLQVNSGATAPEWATAAGGSANWSLLNAGGTSLSGSSTVTVSGISGKDKIMLLVGNASSNTSGTPFRWRLNTDTGSNYYQFGSKYDARSSYDAGTMCQLVNGGAQDSIMISDVGNLDAKAAGFLLITGCNSSGVKVFNGGSNSQYYGSQATQYVTGGYYNSASTISSISINCAGGNFDEGSVYVYTSA